jgi:hypothetical protein
MTQGHVDRAVETLRTNGQPISARNVNRVLRQTPPRFMGKSYRDLLPFLRIQPVISETAQAIRELDALTDTCEAASPTTLPKLLQTIDATWVRCMRVLLRVSARGEETVALTAAFERLREARAAAIVRQARR